jgi:aspartate beta-hydroxylase
MLAGMQDVPQNQAWFGFFRCEDWAMTAARTSQIAELARAANLAMQSGRLNDAAGLWQQIHDLSPDHPQALLHLGQHRQFLGDAKGALALLSRAAAVDPANPIVPLNLAAAYRALGDSQGELAALGRALAIDRYFFPAHLAKAMHFERLGKVREAARLYKDALAVAPPAARLEAWAKAPLEHARELVDKNRAELDSFLQGRLANGRTELDDVGSRRFAECKDIMIGAAQPFVQQPTLLNYPRLPAIPFYERKDFSWVAQVEAATAEIRAEFESVRDADEKEFEAYVKRSEGMPLEQWAELNNSKRWSVFFLWSDGARLDAHCARCPKTAALLASLPMAEVPGAAPSAFFSKLAPKTLIPPHTGVTNARLIVHVPLVVPEGCWFRVGNEKREWKPGEALIFDDTIEHEAWNGSAEPRAVLIFDVWNPYLSKPERALVCELLQGVRDYYAEGDGLDR